MKTVNTAIISLALLFLVALPSLAASKAGVVLPDTQVVNSQQLWLNGIALREKFVFDVYVAGLYLPERTTDAKAILAKDAPRMMIMHFVRNVHADSINKAWYEGLEANVADVTPELKEQFDQLAAMMQDIKNGETMVFTYAPKNGTQVTIANHLKGTIPGKSFADAILSTWIGPKPGPGKRFKAEILGLK